MEPAKELDLFNFDAEENRSNRYILTSPRSLRACANLHIKPMQLLPYSLEELASTSAGEGLGSESLLAVHKECEKQRLALLHKARKERERLTREESQQDNQKVARQDRKSLSHSATPTRRKKSTSNGTYKEEPSSITQRALQSNSSPVWNIHPSQGNGNMMGKDSFPSLPQKDQRIIHAMVLKRESEEQERLQQLWHEQTWNREQVREEREKELAEKHRQQQLAESKAKLEEKVSKIRECQHSLEKAQRETPMANADARLSKHEPEALIQAIKNDLLATGIKLEMNHKKQLQEIRLSEFSRDQQEGLATAYNSFIKRQVRASRNREALTKTLTQEKRWKNMKEKMNFEWNRSELEHNQRTNQELLKETLEKKHLDGLMRYNAEVARRESELQKMVSERRAREHQRKVRADRSALEMKEWQMAVRASCMNGLSRAEAHLRQQRTERTQNLSNKRIDREREHSENMKRVQEELDQKQQWTNHCLETKDKKTKRVVAQREEWVAKSRDTARFSARVREAIKDHYSTNTFDKMAFDGELRAAFEKYGKVCTKN